jgi:RNase H-fold protein (predicted Holliday junction resolvase)
MATPLIFFSTIIYKKLYLKITLFYIQTIPKRGILKHKEIKNKMQRNSRFIALDVGEAWIGVAHNAPQSTLVFPVGTWKKSLFRKELATYLKQHLIEKIIIGLPITLTNSHSEQTKKIIEWKEQEEKFFSKHPFIFFDERLSSQFAKNILSSSPLVSKKSDHAIAASIILENFLQQEQYKENILTKEINS